MTVGFWTNTICRLTEEQSRYEFQLDMIGQQEQYYTDMAAFSHPFIMPQAMMYANSPQMINNQYALAKKKYKNPNLKLVNDKNSKTSVFTDGSGNVQGIHVNALKNEAFQNAYYMMRQQMGFQLNRAGTFLKTQRTRLETKLRQIAIRIENAEKYLDKAIERLRTKFQ